MKDITEIAGAIVGNEDLQPHVCSPREIFWNLVGLVVSRPKIAQWLVERAMRTPYYHLDGYMQRWWLFNPTAHEPDENGRKPRRWEWLPSVRIHHILREATAPDPHNHPWPARTILLKGWYIEQRDEGFYLRTAGQSAKLAADTFHTIHTVSPGGAWTLFITKRYVQRWGFRTPTGFVPHTEYSGRNGGNGS